MKFGEKSIKNWMKLRELYITEFIQLIVYTLLGENIRVLGSPQVFDENIL